MTALPRIDKFPVLTWRILLSLGLVLGGFSLEAQVGVQVGKIYPLEHIAIANTHEMTARGDAKAHSTPTILLVGQNVHQRNPENLLLTNEEHEQAFFCRIESAIERRSKVAPRFRLGSTEYVDMLEGKN